MGQAPDRQVALGAGLSETTPSFHVNRACASSMKAIMLASQSIQLGIRDVVVAGGMENMSKTPHFLNRRRGQEYSHTTVDDAIIADGQTDFTNGMLLGSCVEKLCTEMNINRQTQDEYTYQSYTRAREAIEAESYKWEIVEVTLQR